MSGKWSLFAREVLGLKPSPLDAATAVLLHLGTEAAHQRFDAWLSAAVDAGRFTSTETPHDHA